MSTSGMQANARRFALIAILAICGCFFLAAQASANIYWANPEDSEIGRAADSGSEVNQELVGQLGVPLGIAIDAHHLYWTDPENDSIGRANLDGTAAEAEFITGVEGADGVAVDTGHIYWTTEGETEAIGRSDLEGGNVEEEFIPNTGEPRAIAVDSGHLYWTEEEGIGRSDLSGGAVEQPFVPLASVSHGIALDSGHVYWALESANTIGRAAIDGSEIDNSFIVGLSRPSGLAVGAGHIYWGQGFGGGKAVGRANLNGTGAQPVFIQASGELFGVAVDPPVPTPTPLPTPEPTPTPTPENTPTPKPTPGPARSALCSSVSATAVAFAPVIVKPGALVPGVRATVTISSPSELAISPTVTYMGKNGKSHSVALGAFTYHSTGTRNLRMALPGNLRSTLPIGRSVGLSLQISAVPDSSPSCTAPRLITRKVKAKVVSVLAVGQVGVS